MKVLVRLYDKTLQWAEHRYASRYLAAVSFAEASFFPIPPDFMLAPMSLAKPSKAFHFALIATIFSVFGGILGYYLGLFAFKPIVEPLIVAFGYQEAYQVVLQRFGDWGFWAVFLSAFITPIPYKLFTIGAGALSYHIGGFIVASVLGRSARFFFVSGLIKMGGEPMAKWIRKILDRLGWVILCSLGVVAGAVKFSGVL